MILENFTDLRKAIGKERVEKLLEKVDEEGEIDMEALERFFIHMFQKEDALEEKEGKLSEKEGKLSEKEGKLSEKEEKLSKKEGELLKRERIIEEKIQGAREEEILEIAKNLLNMNFSVEDIEKATGLHKKELLSMV